MRFLYLCLLLLGACSLNQPKTQPRDIFDKILEVMKSKSTESLIRQFGPPDIFKSEQDKDLLVYRYEDSRIDAYVANSDTKKISHLTMFFFEDFDNYAYLMKRFEGYNWIEEKLPGDKLAHLASEIFLVKIPELRMHFEYDNQAPKRKVMWIYFE